MLFWYEGGPRPYQSDSYNLTARYLEALLAEYGMTSTKGPLTPVVNKPRAPESKTNPRLNTAGKQYYQSKVGSTLWAAICTRPEVQFATNNHSRYSKSPLRVVWSLNIEYSTNK